MDTSTNMLSDKQRAAWLSLIVGVGMFASKISAYLLTGSSAIFSDAAESVVHVVATTMALYSIYLSSKPADESHLYGHGNVEFFSAGIEGLLIIIAAFTIIYFAVEDLIHGVTTKSLDIGTIIIAFAGIVNLFLGLYLVKKGKATNSLTLIADGKHVLTDSYTSIGVVIGLILVLVTGFLLLDPLIAILVALNILVTGYKLIRESIGGLMNETDKQMLEVISEKLRNIRKDFWIDIHHLRFWKSGDMVVIDFHFLLPYYFTIKESHLEENYIEKKLLEVFPNCSVRIHMDYCNDKVCKFCNYQKCDVRKEEKSIDYNWSTSLMIGDPVYIAHGKMLAKS
ncbi:MAG: cation diffusion facilitator family transporter [Ignavibacteriales bacterium]|nr:cation diffusion facilitator family transporter [Ignavibacteriales bacterium]